MTNITEKLKSLKESVKPEGKLAEKTEKTKPGKNGGRRPGSGRKPLLADEKRMNVKKSWEDFAKEEVDVTELDRGTREVRKIKMQRQRVVQEKLFKKAQEGDVSAIKEFNDRVGGKSRQPIVGDDEEPPIALDIGVDRMLDKVYGDKDD